MKNVQADKEFNMPIVNECKIIEPFKSNLKVKYSSDLGMWIIHGHSLQRTDVDGKTFYDKKVADNFKQTIDNQDFYFYYDEKIFK